MNKLIVSAAALAMLLAGPAWGDDDDRGRRDHDRDDRRDHRDDDRRGRDRDRDHDRHDWRDDRRSDDRWHNRRRHDDWRAHWRRNDWDRNDWRRDHWRSDRSWRHVPPLRYRLDFGYRSGYELAWRDWHDHGRFNHGWRRRHSHSGYGYWAGYEAGWRDAGRYYHVGYRPQYWAHDPRDGWSFSFHIGG
jgi:hypothetical protein